MPTALARMETSRLDLRNDLAELDRLARWLEQWAGRIVPPDTSLALQLCLEEAVANIIMHGRSEEDQSEIEVERDGETVRARVEDSGRRFDPTRFRRPTAPTSLDQARVGDLGIHLMRSFADGMRYERHGQRNRSTFWFDQPLAA
jgi:anti-sigma regulatory factor (Ser/Thr protein kinase)